ncbi:MAG: hypothetical protein Q7S30_04390 [Candidatus Omnitrophota bacterium]|nr:hypothetical protein [Candidatus Omnitrophota bacterium]
MKKILMCAAIFFAGLACGLILTYGPLHAQESAIDSSVMTKLNEISAGQQEVVAAINAMKEDIQIIKIRVTQSQ